MQFTAEKSTYGDGKLQFGFKDGPDYGSLEKMFVM
jgi:hypothetical protein